MDDSTLLVLVSGIGSVMFVCLVAIIIIVILIIRQRRQDGSGTGSVGSGQLIPVSEYPFKKDTAPWFPHSNTDTESIRLNDGSLEVTLKKNMTGGSSGGGFNANPHKVFPTEGIEFSYRVYFPDDFDFSKGGKLPGVCWGKTSGVCATGGDWSPTSGSFRVMWREGGQGIGYAYLAVTGPGAKAGNKAMENQGGDFTKSVNLNSSNKSGLDIWFKKGPKLQFKKGWNTVWMNLKMNTPGSKDGHISLKINGTENTVKDAVLRNESSVKFNSANIVAFRGGNGKEWESNSDSFVRFKDFSITTA